MALKGEGSQGKGVPVTAGEAGNCSEEAPQQQAGRKPYKDFRERELEGGGLGKGTCGQAESPVDTWAGLEAAERGPNPEDEVIDEEVELDDNVELPPRLSSGAGSQELFTTPESPSQSQQLLSGDQEAREEMPKVLKEQHSDVETIEPEPPKKKINLLLVASDSDDENEHV
ncbi:hypothetical protein UY3_00235 [Chelonia mydas]|uniref:Uncharacterized protein n=1 Tax=Chelonia mydas TaxID=8469 RepID=M7BZ40_CHEMY|nr:hypothetical protein UY3_00235 [Chelonia mydas]